MLIWLRLHSHFSPTILKIFQEKQRKLRHKDEICLTVRPHVIIYPVPAGIPQLEWCVGWFWTWVVFYEEKLYTSRILKGLHDSGCAQTFVSIIGLHWTYLRWKIIFPRKKTIYDNPRYWEMPTCLPPSFSTYRFRFSKFIPPPTPAMNSWVLSVSPFQLFNFGSQATNLKDGWMDVLPRKHPRSFPENEWLVQMCFLLKCSSLFLWVFQNPLLPTLQLSKIRRCQIRRCPRIVSESHRTTRRVLSYRKSWDVPLSLLKRKPDIIDSSLQDGPLPVINLQMG